MARSLPRFRSATGNTTVYHLPLQKLNNSNWQFKLQKSGEVGYWIDPLTGNIHDTEFALRIQEERDKQR